MLFTIYMECEANGPCLFQIPQEFLVESQTIGVDNRFQSILSNKANNLHNIGMDQGISSSQRDAISFSRFLKNF